MAAEEEGVVDRSKAPIFTLIGELRESFRQWTGEEVREGMERGGGEENLRHSLGDLLFKGSVPHAPWLVAKKSSRDLRERKQADVQLLTRTGSNESPVLLRGVYLDWSSASCVILRL